MYRSALGVAMLLPLLTGGGGRCRHRDGRWWCWWAPSASERSCERRADDRCSLITAMPRARIPPPRPHNDEAQSKEAWYVSIPLKPNGSW